MCQLGGVRRLSAVDYVFFQQYNTPSTVTPRKGSHKQIIGTDSLFLRTRASLEFLTLTLVNA